MEPSLPIALDLSSAWDRFVYIFSTISIRNHKGINTTSLSINSRLYWSVEALVIFLLLVVSAVANGYFFVSRRRAIERSTHRFGHGNISEGNARNNMTSDKNPRNARAEAFPNKAHTENLRLGSTHSMLGSTVSIMRDNQSGDDNDSSCDVENPDGVASNTNTGSQILSTVDSDEANSESNANQHIPATITTARAKESSINSENNKKVEGTTTESRKMPQFQNQAKEAAFRRPRLLYLDNIKVMCVALVFWHHTAEVLVGELLPPHSMSSPAHKALHSFLTLNRAWFMQLFFFISAYFVPTSVDRKGYSWFIRDKLKRIGLPMLAVSLGIAPLRNFIVHSLVRGRGYEYSVNFGVTWFLVWLQAFNAFYMGVHQFLGDHQVERYHLPSNSIQLFTALLIGSTQGIIAYFQGGEWLAWGFLKIQWAYAPAHAAYFAFGVISKRNDWLFQLSEGFPWTMIVASLISACGLVTNVSTGEEKLVWYCLSWGILSAIMNISFIQLVFCCAKRWADVTTPLTRFFSKNAYAFYLCHLNVVFLLSFVWVILLNLKDGRYPYNWDVTVSNDWWLVFGGVFVTITGMPISWFSSWCLCKVPALKDIL